jgi:delta11-fatty-acid desaturase
LFCRYFSGGLNQQIEHHMFPCVNHCHLADLAPKVKAICAMHGVRYNEVSGYGEALNLHLEHNRALGIPPFCDPH